MEEKKEDEAQQDDDVISISSISPQPQSSTSLMQTKLPDFFEGRTQATSNSVCLKKEEILELVKNNDPRITLSRNEAKSEVWNGFSLVYLDEKKTNFVKCNKCATIYTYDSHAGTNSMLRHMKVLCKEVTSKCGTTNTKIGTVSPFFCKVVPRQKVEDFNRTIIKALAQDLRPLNIVKGDGFKLMAQAFINAGSEFGKIRVEDLLAHQTTLKRTYLPQVFNQIRANVILKVSTSMSFPVLSLTTDLWSNTFNQDNYLTLTAHFFDENFYLHSYVLADTKFTAGSKTILNIRKEISSILQSCFPTENIQHMMKQSYAVTDSGSNMPTVFEKRLACQCHILNLVLEHTFSDETYNAGKLNEANTLIRSCKSLVTYFKQSGLNSKLKFTLKQDVTTRWNSHFIMLSSVLKSLPDVKMILVERGESQKLDEINEEDLKIMVDFLALFKECSEELSAENKPTLHLVPVWYKKLEDHLSPAENDSSFLKSLKAETLVWFHTYCTGLDDICYIACILCPRFKNLKFVDKLTRTRIISLTRRMMVEYESTPNEHEPPAKKKRNKNKFDDYEDSSGEEDNTDELEKYLAEKQGKEDKIELFWYGANRFPKLRRLAANILRIPASSAPSERVFSTTGNVLSSRRSGLQPGTAEKLVFIHENSKSRSVP